LRRRLKTTISSTVLLENGTFSYVRESFKVQKKIFGQKEKQNDKGENNKTRKFMICTFCQILTGRSNSGHMACMRERKYKYILGFGWKI
jgi:hypothetical protein